MKLIDAGPLFAALDPKTKGHRERMRAFFKTTTGPFATTWPAFTEAMYLCDRQGGSALQTQLWGLHRDGIIQFVPSRTYIPFRLQDLMATYSDLPMDLADATLVVAAEVNRINTIVTIDKDFYIYRINGKDAFNVINPLA